MISKNKVLRVDGLDRPFIDGQFVLELNASGRALITCGGRARPRGALTLSLSLAEKPLEAWFRGFVTEATLEAAGKWRVQALEASAALRSRLPITLRHPSARELLAKVSETTGLAFKISISGNASWLEKRLPRYHSMGTAEDVLSELARALPILDSVWFQQRDGLIFFGEWEGYPPAANNVSLPDSLILARQSGELEIPIVPSLRPGARVNQRRVRLVRLADQKMTLDLENVN